MKKILLVLVLISFLAVLAAPILTSAQEIPKGCRLKRPIIIDTTTYSGYVTYEGCPMCCLLNTIYNITDWAFVILMAIAVIFVIIGGFMFMTAAGAPEKTTAARNYILYAVVGIIVALLAKAIPPIVKMIVGV